MFIHYFSMKYTVPVWYMVIKLLFDTLSDFGNINHGKYSK